MPDDDPTVRCPLCRSPAQRWKPNPDVSAHDFDCLLCGKYRIGVATEQTMRALGANGMSTWVEPIKAANAQGFRLSIPGAMKIPLEA